MSIGNQILDALDITVMNAVKKASYDKTIQAQILSCEDPSIGKYRCKYQDSVFYAYGAAGVDSNYSKGAMVYVLIPGNDMSKTKTILGSASALGVDYVVTVEEDQEFDIQGTNCITNDNTYYLNTDNKDYRYQLYKYGSTGNVLEIDEESLKYYLKESSSLIAGATFKTTISSSRQYRGQYGIIFNLIFKDNSTGEQVSRSYIIDEDTMKSDPYKLVYPMRQIQVFDIDGQNFERIDSVVIFNKDFPNAEGTVSEILLTEGDIEISSIELIAANKIQQADLDGVSLSFYTPQGTFFKATALSSEYKTITAQLKIKGKLSKATNIEYYWGREDVGITSGKKQYCSYLGKGWRCLNDSNVVAAATQTDDEVITWVPGTDTFILKITEATARDNKFKVAAIYNDTVVTKQINIRNLIDGIPTLSIVTSDNITDFYYDVGHPTLTCLVDGVERPQYSYYWGVETNTGSFSAIEQTNQMVQLKQDYDAAVDAYESLISEIADGEKFANAQSALIQQYEDQIQSFGSIQRVYSNKLYDVQISNITNFATFKCTVYDDYNRYLGTASIVLRNIIDEQPKYSLIINNGSTVFKYDENGVAPNNESKQNPQQIQALSFTIYDQYGRQIEESIIKNLNNCQVRWAVPIKNTLIVNKDNGAIADSDDEYVYYDNIYTIIYDINQRYNNNKINDQIKLFVTYKDLNLVTQTNFTFTKDGEPGTNGSEYTVRLVPNTRMDNAPRYPMITYVQNQDKYILNYGLNSSDSETAIGINDGFPLLKAQLWHSGELVWEGTSAEAAALDGQDKPSSVNWSILSNKYTYSISDQSAFVITNAASGLIKYSGDYLHDSLAVPKANIIKCTLIYNDKEYYGTVPFTTAWVSNNNYRIKINENSGFRYVTYSAEGLLPQYDSSTPFDFICQQKIDGYWEDISNVGGDHRLSYTPGYCGNTYNGNQLVNSNMLQLLSSDYYREGLSKNQFYYKPKAVYTGESVNNTVTCQVQQSGEIVMRIAAPIHFLLNRFSFSNINGWDGNSVEINQDKGYIISPQMGAGRKDQNNSFTGVVMGEVKQPEKTEKELGLFAFSKGKRSFFLDSETGGAIFGLAGKGRMTIDPSQDTAMLYSDNFWKNYNNKGFPSSYGSGNQNKQGMLIDLTKPQIRWGNGNVWIKQDGSFIFGNNQKGKVEFTGDRLDIRASSISFAGPEGQWKDMATVIGELTQDLSKQIDAQIETWAQDTNPALSWSVDSRAIHDKDLWYYTGISNLTVDGVTIKPSKTYQYNYSTGKWVEYNSPVRSLFDLADGKSTIFYGETDGTYANVKANDYLITADGSTYKRNVNNNSWTKVTDYEASIRKYMVFFDNVGLVVGDMRSSVPTSADRVYGPNVLLGSDSLKIRNGSSVLAEYGGNGIIFNNSYDFLVGKTDGNNPSFIRWKNGKIQICADTVEIGGVAALTQQDKLTITGTEVKYAISSNQNQPSDSSFTYSSVPTVSDGNYLWTRTTVTYSDGHSTITYSKAKQGSDGSPGSPGRGISSTEIRYASNNSGTSAPSSGWSPTIPTVSDGNYLWTRTVINYISGSSDTSYSVARQGQNGKDITSQYVFFNSSGTWQGLNIKYTNYDIRAVLTADGLNFYNGSTIMASYASTGITLKSDGENSVVINNHGLIFYGQVASGWSRQEIARIYCDYTYNTSGEEISSTYYTFGTRYSGSKYWNNKVRASGSYYGTYSFTAGQGLIANGTCSFAEGNNTLAVGDNSHAEGNITCAFGNSSHAEGWITFAKGAYSHAGGYRTEAGYAYQRVIGKYNSNNSSNAFEIGWGDSSTNKNIFSVDTSGGVHAKGNFYINCNNDGSGGTMIGGTSWNNYDSSITASVGSKSMGRLREKDNLYVLDLWISNITGTANSETTIAKINSSYAPNVNRVTPGYSLTACRDPSYVSGGYALYVFINTSGEVVVSRGLYNYAGGIWLQAVWYRV